MVDIKRNTHIVIKRDDVTKYLSEEERDTLDKIVYEIKVRRVANLIPPHNEYIVCNWNEPYAQKVLDVILEGEELKSGTIFIDVEKEAWESIKQAVAESPWIPEDYYMNDWVADIRSFLLKKD